MKLKTFVTNLYTEGKVGLYELENDFNSFAKDKKMISVSEMKHDNLQIVYFYYED